jgi:catechol 2,3-dioxygenase-like lactoylglutathione lyase family enzyme
LDLNHLHLHVRDVEASRAFYERYFGFAPHVKHGEILFLRNERGFDLALAPDPSPSVFPDWFHFGFRLDTPAAVRSLHERMRAEKVAIVKPLYEDDELASFRCADPDGHGIEVYWE